MAHNPNQYHAGGCCFGGLSDHFYTVIVHVRFTDIPPRFFIAGTLASWITQIISVFIFSQYAGTEQLENFTGLPSPIHPGFLMQLGMLLNMAGVALGL